jgi:hypothetical protein
MIEWMYALKLWEFGIEAKSLIIVGDSKSFSKSGDDEEAIELNS